MGKQHFAWLRVLAGVGLGGCGQSRGIVVPAFAGWWALCYVLLMPAWALAQPKSKEDEGPKIPPPEDAVVQTADGVTISLTYYGSNKGREAVPVVLLHGHRGSRKDFAPLALYLQALGHAVVAPDLRGHGESMIRKVGTRSETLDASRFTARDIEAMSRLDMIMIKEYLWTKHNAGELNLNRLCLVGAEMGASVAMDFAAYDAVGYMQGNPPGSPTYGALQVGRFVKAIVLISPEWSFRGLTMAGPLNNPFVSRSIPMLILVGGESTRLVADAERIHKLLSKNHPEPSEEDRDKYLAKKTLFLGVLKTGMQGTKMLQDKKLGVEKHIARFIHLRLINSDEAREWTWKELRKPHQ